MILFCFQRLFTENGGEFLDGHKVKEITPGPIIRVTTDQGVFTARRLIITAGAWAPAIMATLGVHLPFKFEVSLYMHSITVTHCSLFQTMRAEVLYWRAEHPEHYSPDVFPTFGMYDATHHPFYGLPIFEYPGLVKVRLCHVHV